MTSHSASSDFRQFFRQWMSNPMQVSAIAPSGERLAHLMTHEVQALDEPILELGPGTGVFTRALLKRGVRESDLTLIEFGAEFVDVLHRRFPLARIVQMDAGRIADAGLFDDKPVGAVVSGLPLLSMSPAQVSSVLSGAFRVMRAGGAFYQFTYGPRCPAQRRILDELGLTAKRIGGTVRNLPPASVYRISRKTDAEISIGQASPFHKRFGGMRSLPAPEILAERGVRDAEGRDVGL